jgi:phosphoribosylanthranilate isomerase
VVKVKICGVRRLAEAEAALEAGADFLGLVFYPPSPRNLEPEAARELLGSVRARVSRTDWSAVGVFVNAPEQWVNDLAEGCGLDYVQLHGTESAAYCARIRRPVIKALRLSEICDGPLSAETYGAERLLLDSQVPGYWGGSGVRFDWSAARRYAPQVLVAGGLTPDNVEEALTMLEPWGLDVSSGVERDGLKDAALIRAFLERVRQWERRTDSDAG